MSHKIMLPEKLTRRLSDAGLANASDAARNGRRELSDALDTVVSRSHRLAHDARERAIQIRDEGRRRAKATGDALAGRYPKREPWIITAVVVGIGVGVGVGAAATAVARQIVISRER